MSGDSEANRTRREDRIRHLHVVGEVVAEERRKRRNPEGERLSVAGVEQAAACLAAVPYDEIRPSLQWQADWQGVHRTTAWRRRCRLEALGGVQIEDRGPRQPKRCRLEWRPGSRGAELMAAWRANAARKAAANRAATADRRLARGLTSRMDEPPERGRSP